jgi:hypothetical protein
MSIETDKFDALYKRLKPHGVTMTALLAKAVGAALASHPVMFAGEQCVGWLTWVEGFVEHLDS